MENKKEETIEGLYQDHLKAEPYRGKYFKEVKMWLETSDYIRWKIKRDALKRLCAIPPEKRQEIMLFFKSTGKTIRETAEYFKINSSIIADLVYYNIDKVHLLKEISI